MTFLDWAKEKGRTLDNQDDEYTLRSAWVKFYKNNQNKGAITVFVSAYEKFGAQGLDTLFNEHWDNTELNWVVITRDGGIATHRDAPMRQKKST